MTMMMSFSIGGAINDVRKGMDTDFYVCERSSISGRKNITEVVSSPTRQYINAV